MRITPPDGIEDVAIKTYLQRLIRQLTGLFEDRPDKNTPRDSVLLVSPSGSVYSVKVSDAGVLSTVQLYEA